MDSLIAFYEANPTFFREIFIPTYLECIYTTIGLREHMRAPNDPSMRDFF